MMKRIYISPECELIRFSLTDAILASRQEDDFTEVIGGGGNYEGELPVDDGLT